jgi:hypothetical protein
MGVELGTWSGSSLPSSEESGLSSPGSPPKFLGSLVS